MNILICCNQIPYPLKDGYSYACLNLAKSLKQHNCNVDIFAYNTTKKTIDLSNIPEKLKKDFNWYTPALDNKLKIWDALVCLLKNRSYNIDRFDNKYLKSELSVLLKKKDYQIIQFEGLYLAPLIDTCKTYSKAKIVLRSHNIEHLIWKRLMNNEKHFIKKLYLKLLYQQLKTYELKAINKFDAILPISRVDIEFFKSYSKTLLQYLPFGIEVNEIKKSVNNFCFFFIGSLDWQPNYEGLIWFIENVWCKFKKQHPEAIFKVAGKNTPESLKKYQDDQTLILGEIDDANKFIEENGIMVVPLFSGSGIRIKIIEGMAQGKCIISTPIGAEGLYQKGDNHIIIASDSSDFINKMESIILNPDLIGQIGVKAHKYVLNEHELVKAGEQLKSFYESIVS